MSWAPPHRTDGRCWCADPRHLPGDIVLADVLYSSPIQEAAPLCRAHADSWRAYLERVAAESSALGPELVPVATPLLDHRLPR
jgi:hypothetical protein